MAEAIVTYRSENAPDGREWVAYINLGSDYFGVRFQASTEVEVIARATQFWEADRKKREDNIAAREAARVKAAETRARKDEVNTAHKISSEA